VSRPPGRVPLARALSKLGILSRARASAAICDGRVRVDGRLVRDPRRLVVPERILVSLDEAAAAGVGWRAVMLNKPPGVLTTRRDPSGRRTVYDLLDEDARGLVAVGRLDLATTGLLLFTSDTQLANWITDPVNAVPRVYVVTVRGEVRADAVARLTSGVRSRGDLLRASAATLRKASARESHLMVELREGKNREVRRLLEAIGHEVTGLARVQLGGLTLGDLAPGHTRELSRAEVMRAFRVRGCERARALGTPAGR
jgi:23S rRNA pseudouridine2605 synthase